jgi:hypothetical protein
MTKDTVKSIPFAEQVCYNNVQVAVFFVCKRSVFDGIVVIRRISVTYGAFVGAYLI